MALPQSYYDQSAAYSRRREVFCPTSASGFEFHLPTAPITATDIRPFSLRTMLPSCVADKRTGVATVPGSSLRTAPPAGISSDYVRKGRNPAPAGERLLKLRRRYPVAVRAGLSGHPALVRDFTASRMSRRIV